MMFSINLTFLILIIFRSKSIFCGDSQINEKFKMEKDNFTSETGRFFGDIAFSIFDFVDNLMIRNQEKLTRQATTTTPNPIMMGMMDYGSPQFTEIQKIEVPDTPKNALVYLWNKFKEKIDAILLSKILLKLIVFKKLVKFLSLICLLFFLPSLKEDQTGRIFKDDYDNDIIKESM